MKMKGSRLSQNQTRSGHERPTHPRRPEREAEAIRNKEGIPLLEPVVDDLLEIAKKTGIPFKLEKGRLAVKKTP